MLFPLQLRLTVLFLEDQASAVFDLQGMEPPFNVQTSPFKFDQLSLICRQFRNRPVNVLSAAQFFIMGLLDDEMMQ